MIAGSAESREGGGTYAERTVRYRDLSPEGLSEKVRFTTTSQMENRMTANSASAGRTPPAVQAYTVHDFHPRLVDELVRRGALRSGLTWHFARPPVVDLEYEMDCRRVLRETGDLALARVERVAQAVAEQIERQHHEEDRKARPDRHPRRLGQEALRRVEHAAPGRRGRLLAEAEERQRGFGDDGGGDRQRRLHQQRRQDVRQDVRAARCASGGLPSARAAST